MSTSLWIVTVIVVAWTSFLIGYGVSALTAVRQPAAEVSAPAGGYGAAREGAPAPAGGYGDAKPGARAPAGGYGEARPGATAPAGGYGSAAPRPRAPAGGYGGSAGRTGAGAPRRDRDRDSGEE